MVDHHAPPEVAAGAAMNGRVGSRLADQLEALVASHTSARTVCDIGSGNGHLAGRLGARGLTVVGVDRDDVYLEIARRTQASDRVTFLKGLIGPHLRDQLQVHPPFDLVVSSDVIEHMYDPLELLTMAHAILRPGGTAIIGTPYHGYLKNVAISVLGKWDEHHGVHWNGGHIKFFSAASLGKMMRTAGFNEPQFHFHGRYPGLWKHMIAVATKPESA